MSQAVEEFLDELAAEDHLGPRIRLAVAFQAAAEAAGAAVERERVRKLVEEIRLARHIPAGADHYDYASGYSASLDELLRRLEEK